MRPLRVLARPAFANRAVNPYNARVYGGMAAHGIEVVEYGYPRALWPADIVHVHWPESSFNHGLLGARLTTETLLATLRWMKARGAKVVWTMHNLRAHEQRYVDAEAAFWARYVPLVDAVIALSDASLARARAERPDLAHLPAYVVRHPHYRGAYRDDMTRTDARAGLGLPLDARVIAFFGHVKTYKNVPGLIEAARALGDDVRLVVAGRARDRALADEVRAAAGNDPRVTLDLRHVPDDQAQGYLRAADLIALPYRDILNSGTALLGLSFDRPVWLPDDGPAAALADDLAATVGTDWVHRGPLAPASLRAALNAAARLPERTGGEHLAAFSPEAVCAETARVLREIAS